MEDNKEEKRKRVYVCEDSLEGILTAVYEAYQSRYGHRYIQISEGNYTELDFFSDYMEIKTDYEKAERVARSIRHKISYESWKIIMYASMCARDGKGQDIYRFLNFGYEMGGKVVDCLGEEHIRRVLFDKKTVSRELDRMRGFTRFLELKDGSLFARIGPKNNLVPLLAPHFADRFPEERWILYDVNRKLSAMHEPQMGWFLTEDEIQEDVINSVLSNEEKKMESCWKTFFDTIGIEARRNPKLQQQMLPKYYRKYFTKSGDKCFG